MLVTTTTSGRYSSSDPSLSSASATKHVPLPWWALVPASPKSPPTANDGSNPLCCNATMSMEVVVVLPCVPVTISVVWPAISFASTAGRRIIGMPRLRASTSSGLVFGIAACVVTTAVGPPGSMSSDDGVVPDPDRRRRGRATRSPRANPWHPIRTPCRRGPAGCARSPTCRPRRCPPCAPAAVRRAGRGFDGARSPQVPPVAGSPCDVERYLGHPHVPRRGARPTPRRPSSTPAWTGR